ncbi:MAG: hypothetical protein P4L64_11175 [Caulobacteraceae bacterium]|nr:hypothetical protein [Caulobacteraceae bacterium]
MMSRNRGRLTSAIGAIAAIGAISLQAAAASATALPDTVQFTRRIDADLDQGNDADLTAVRQQLQALIKDARAPGAPAGRLKAVSDLFNQAYSHLLAKCPARKPPAGVLQGFAQLAASLGQPARQKEAQACAAGSPGGPGGYDVSGGGAGLKVHGVVADISHTFEIKGNFPGGSTVLTYTPDAPGASAGKLSYTMAGSGVTGSGKGTYTLAKAPGGVIKLTEKAYGCVHGIAGSCRNTTEVITLTPRGR